MINFLQVIYDRGLCTLHNLVRFKKGVFNQRLCLPKHVQTWDPQIVLDYLETYDGVVNQMLLARKFAVLLALSSYQRVSTLHSLKFQTCPFMMTVLLWFFLVS